jgi:hypothetical protein
MESEAELDFIGEYVDHVAKTVTTLMREQPTVTSREQAIGRFQVANDVIWSPEIYHRVQARSRQARSRRRKAGR